MKREIFVIHPPVYQPTEPPPGIPYLMAVLRAAGLDGSVIDLNLAFFEAAMREGVLTRCLELVERRLLRLDALSSLDGRRLLEYAPLLEHARLEDLPRRIEGDVDVFRSERFYDFESYLTAMESVIAALGLISATVTPFEIRFDRVGSLLHDFDSSQELYQAIDEFLALQENIVREILESALDAAFGGAEPRLVGVSITFPAQLFFGVLVARLVRRRFPGAFVILGGPLAASLSRRAHKAGQYPLLTDADAVVIGDGEEVFREVVERVTSGRPVVPMTNLLLYDRGSLSASLSSVDVVRDLDALPCPDFSDFALHRYWVPTPVLPLPIARGCYWDKCTFCYYGFVPDGRRATAPYRERSVHKIADDMATLRERHGCRHFDFSVDLVSPRLLDSLAEEVCARGLDVRWGLEIRAERSFTVARCRRLKAGGLTYADFGLESMDQEVLDGIQKGTRVEQYADVMRNFYEAGVATSAMGFFDFPIEDVAAGLRSIAFLRLHAENLSEIGWDHFGLGVGSQVYRDPARFGISTIVEHDEEDLALWASLVPSVDVGSAEERAVLDREYVALLDENGYAVAPSRPFAGGGSGEAHTFLLFSRLGPTVLKDLGRHARARVSRPAPEAKERARGAAFSLRYAAPRIQRHFQALTALLSDRKGSSLIKLERRRSREDRLSLWDATARVLPP